ncbi:hypothetical protein [Actinomadura rugatobispora]|uniref:Uncharacterized protein n=1 Tax=Actinomadura rugatobispora TaxID=1994 RepID=A0ABW1A800_9ACTN
MIQSARVIFFRPGAGLRDSFRAYTLLIDGVPCGNIRVGEQLSLDVHPGTHWARARMDWFSSRETYFDAVPGHAVWIRVEPAGGALQALWQRFSDPKGSIVLTPSTPQPLSW